MAVPLPPFAVQRLDHVVLRVRDLDRSEAFYRTVLGCEVARRRAGLGRRHLRAGASRLGLGAGDGPVGLSGGAAAGASARNLDHLCLRVAPFDEAALVAHLAAHGLAPHGPATRNFGAEGDGPSLYLDDPDGNTIELKGAAA